MIWMLSLQELDNFESMWRAAPVAAQARLQETVSRSGDVRSSEHRS
jgi:hypothetical protein